MNFHIMTLFPDMVMGGLNTSITGRAMGKRIGIEMAPIAAPVRTQRQLAGLRCATAMKTCAKRLENVPE